MDPRGSVPQISRRRFLTGAAAALGALSMPACAGIDGRDRWKRSAEAGLGRARAWLWGAQHEDGRFPSETYGLLATGQSLTPFALDALLQGGGHPLASEAPRVSLALDAMFTMRNESGALGFSGPAPDYPCYATALMLSCLGRMRPTGWHDRAAPGVAWLRGQQFRAGDGWADHPAQGGWGMGSPSPRTPPNAGHVDLSMTRRVVEGLRAADTPADDPALHEAADFVLRCQTRDGSFVYSPVELALNKGLRASDGAPLGYGSATTDGLLCLDALGLGDTPASVRAHTWLLEHHRVDRNPGVAGGPMEPFASAMRGYYRAGAAHCFARLGGPAGWRRELAETVVAEQATDGSVRNESALQKEDDPIIGTSFAVHALAALVGGG